MVFGTVVCFGAAVIFHLLQTAQLHDQSHVGIHETAEGGGDDFTRIAETSDLLGDRFHSSRLDLQLTFAFGMQKLLKVLNLVLRHVDG